MRNAGGDYAEIIGIQAEGLTRKLEVGASLKLEKQLGPIVLVHSPELLHLFHLVRHLEADLVAFREFDRAIKNFPHLGTVVRAQPFGGKDSGELSFFSHGEEAYD